MLPSSLDWSALSVHLGPSRKCSSYLPVSRVGNYSKFSACHSWWRVAIQILKSSKNLPPIQGRKLTSTSFVPAQLLEFKLCSVQDNLRILASIIEAYYHEHIKQYTICQSIVVKAITGKLVFPNHWQCLISLSQDWYKSLWLKMIFAQSGSATVQLLDRM